MPFITIYLGFFCHDFMRKNITVNTVILSVYIPILRNNITVLLRSL